MRLICLILLFVFTTAVDPYEDGIQGTRFQESLDAAQGQTQDEDPLPEEAAGEPEVQDPLDSPSAPTSVVVLDHSAPAPSAQVVIEPGMNGDIEGLPPAEPYNQDPDKPKGKLELALDAVKEDIIAKSKQIADESRWVASVHRITETYRMKSSRVATNIDNLRRNGRDLFKRKKQIENLKLQQEIETKLGDAHDDLTTLLNALHHVDDKRKDISQSKGSIQSTIKALESQLMELRGEKSKAEDEQKEGETETETETETEPEPDAEEGDDSAKDDQKALSDSEKVEELLGDQE
jgi:hypothetical protein